MHQKNLRRPAKILIIILLLFATFSCRQEKDFSVTPIDEEFNRNYINGRGLDTNYFSAKDVMQYYEVAGYDGLANETLLSKLNIFSKARLAEGKLNHIQTLTFLFYKKQPFVDYRDHLYESAREDQNRRLIGYNDKLLATIIYDQIKAKPKTMAVRKLLYDNGKLKLKETETISVK